MDFKIMFTTFSLVFLAELGDKTQLATFCLSADSEPKISVFLGAAGALILISLLAVFFGEVVSRFLPAIYIKIGAGFFFILAGAWILYSAVRVIYS